MEITFKEFKEHLEEIERIQNLTSEIIKSEAKFNRSSKEEFSFSFPTMQDNVINLLESILNDKDDWIGYWVYELDCGKKYQPGMIRDADGRYIPLATIEDLWDLLHSS